MSLGIEAVAYGRLGSAGGVLIPFQFGLGLSQRDAVAQAADKGEEVVSTIAVLGRIELQWSPELRRIQLSRREGEALRHHSDHGARRAVQSNIAAQNGTVAAEGALPQAVGD